MPRIILPAHHDGGRIERVVIAAIATVVALTATVGTAAPVAGSNLSSAITASRRNQIASESYMRGADGQLKVLHRDLKVTRRKLKRGEKKLARVRAHRVSAATAVSLAQARLHAALPDELPLEPPIEFVLPGEIPATAPTEVVVPLISSVGIVESLVDEEEPLPSGVGPPVTDGLPSTAAEIASLQHDLKAERKVLRQAKAKSRRVARAKRLRVRHVSAIRRQQRAAIARRESAERSLGSWIKSMTRLSKRRAAKKAKVRPGSGGFIRPSSGPLSQGYHSGHDGLDIVQYKGAPIRASAVGVVAFVGWNPWDNGRRAFVVVIGHSTGYETIYGHLLPIRKVTVGQLVRKGQTIGYMGNTGHSSGPHVHWETSRNWRTFNPGALL